MREKYLLLTPVVNMDQVHRSQAVTCESNLVSGFNNRGFLVYGIETAKKNVVHESHIYPEAIRDIIEVDGLAGRHVNEGIGRTHGLVFNHAVWVQELQRSPKLDLLLSNGRV